MSPRRTSRIPDRIIAAAQSRKSIITRSASFDAILARRLFVLGPRCKSVLLDSKVSDKTRATLPHVLKEIRIKLGSVNDTLPNFEAFGVAPPGGSAHGPPSGGPFRADRALACKLPLLVRARTYLIPSYSSIERLVIWHPQVGLTYLLVIAGSRGV